MINEMFSLLPLRCLVKKKGRNKKLRVFSWWQLGRRNGGRISLPIPCQILKVKNKTQIDLWISQTSLPNSVLGDKVSASTPESHLSLTIRREILILWYVVSLPLMVVGAGEKPASLFSLF